jgi:integrase
MDKTKKPKEIYVSSIYYLKRSPKDVTNMDENGFRGFLQERKYSDKTIKAYLSYVKTLERYLLKRKGRKRLENATPRDIKDFFWWGRKELKSVAPYLAGIYIYYEYVPRKRLRDTIKGISRDKPAKSNKEPISWGAFSRGLKNAEKIGISDRDRALLNLLWSEMDSGEILQLKIFDIDFRNKVITSRVNRTTFHVTPETWYALGKYLSTKDWDKDDRLFPIGERRLQQIAKRYLEDVGQTPVKLRLSCKEDLIKQGREIRFLKCKREKTIISLDKDDLTWVDELIEKKRFRNRNDVVEYALEQMRESQRFGDEL